MQRKKLTDKEIEEQKKQQKIRSSATGAARKSGKINKKEEKGNSAKAQVNTPRSQKKIETVKKK